MVELTKQERELEKSTAEAHGSLSLGLLATALLVWNTVDGVGWISIAVLGALFMLSSIYLVFVHKWKRKEFLGIAAKVQIKHVAWFLGFTAIGIGLIRTEVNCLAIPGIICVGLGYAILFFGSLRAGKEMATKGRGTQEVKEQGRPNTIAMDRKELIELYKTTLEEFRHHDRIYVQALVGVAIIVPAFLVAVGFLFGGDSPVHSEYVPYVKWGIFGLTILLAGFLWWNLYRINERLKVCSNVIGNIESKLLEAKTIDETDEAAKTSELSRLLVKRELEKIKVKRFGQMRFWVYLFTVVAAFVALGLLLFVCID